MGFIIIAIIFEIIVTVFVMWGILTEEKLIEWENKHFPKLKEWRCK